MFSHSKISDSDLRSKIKQRKISFGGNHKLKIYGTLSCTSGKRMKRKNRVFFTSETKAIKNGFRPCGHCMKQKYKKWKNETIDDIINKTKNWLPQDGTVNYYGKLFNQKEADNYLEKLLNNIEWRNDEAIIFGKKIITKRKVAWYGEKPFEYTYSNTTKYALSWTKELFRVRALSLYPDRVRRKRTRSLSAGLSLTFYLIKR